MEEKDRKCEMWILHVSYQAFITFLYQMFLRKDISQCD